MALGGLLLFCIGLLAFPALSAETQAQRHETGRKLYNYRCYFCHGYSGDARTLATTYLSPPPTDFTRADRSRLTPQTIAAIIDIGRPGTAMKSFHGILNRDEMTRIAEFIAVEFIERKAINTRYHTRENGWAEHSRYRVAFPFARGEIPLSRPWDALSPEQAEGRRLYLSACVTCHDRGAADEDAVAWDARRAPKPAPAGSSPADAPKTPSVKRQAPKGSGALARRER